MLFLYKVYDYMYMVFVLSVYQRHLPHLVRKCILQVFLGSYFGEAR